MDIKKIVFFILTFLGTTLGQLFVRIIHLDGSLDQWWFLIPPLSLPPLSIIPAYYIYKGHIKKGTAGLPYDIYSAFPILLTIIVNLLIERYFELTGASGAVIKYLFNILTFTAIFYLRDDKKCNKDALVKSRDYVCKRITCDQCPKIPCPIVKCPTVKCPAIKCPVNATAKPQVNPNLAKPFPFGNTKKGRKSSRRRGSSKGKKSKGKKSKGKKSSKGKKQVESFESIKLNNILSKYEKQIMPSNNSKNNLKNNSQTKSSLSNRIKMLINNKEHFSESMTQLQKQSSKISYTNIVPNEQNPLAKKPMEPVKGTPFFEKVIFEAAVLSLLMPLIPYILRWIPYFGDAIISLGGISPYLGTVVEILVRFLIMKLLFIFVNMYNGINIAKSCKVNYKIYYPIIAIVIGLVINVLIESNKVPLIPLENA